MDILSSSQTQVTTLFPNDVLARAERLRINSLRRFTDRRRGEHLSGKGGQSTEFADYRSYVEGDDIRYVDWNIFARLHQPFMKIFHHEEEMHVVLLIDGSSSMLFENKLEQARRIAAAMGTMGLFNVERVSVYTPTTDDGPIAMLPPCRGRGNMPKLFAFIESIEGGGDVPLEDAVDLMLRRHRGRGVVVVLSDFLTYGDLVRPLNRLFSAGLEIFAVQILGPTEIDPEVTGDLRFIDCETENMLDITSSGDLLSLYQEYRQAYQRNLETLCRQRTGRTLSISAADPIDWVLFDLFRRNGWVI